MIRKPVFRQQVFILDFNPWQMVEQKISDYVTVIIDEDEDVRIIDQFLERTENILPKDEAIGVAKFILQYFKETVE